MVLTRTLFERIRQKCDEQGWQPDEALHRGEIAQHYPPATESQLLATEAALNFTLPPTLRTLYAQIANGGFGPGFGIIGAFGGFACSSIGGNIVDAYHALAVGTPLVDYTQYKRELGVKTTFELPIGVWCEPLLPLCDLGCLTTSFLDIQTGQVLRGAPVSRTSYVLRPQAPSLEAWLESWLQDEL
jgi:hypothetical protein